MTKNLIHRNHEVPSLDDSEGSPDTVIVHGETITRQQLLDDVNSLADRLPGRRVTRNLYREKGTISEAAWMKMFGKFPEFLRQAGLQDSRYSNRVALRTSQHASVDHLRELDGARKTYGTLYERDKGKRWKTLIAGSDFHDVEIDPFFLRVFLDTVKLVDPDVVCLDGDIYDVPEFGRYTVDPREWDAEGRIRAGHDICRRVREAAPETQIDLVEGNHEARVIKHFADASPALREVLSGFHEMDIRKFFRLDEFEINYIAQCDMFAFTDHQLKKETQKNHKVYWDSLLACHFPEARHKGKPGFNGHHHQHLCWSMHNVNHGSYEWHQLGAGHIREAPYCDGSKWNNGFVIANVDAHYKSVAFDYVTVGPTMAVAAGQFYYRQKDEFYPALEQELEALKSQ